MQIAKNRISNLYLWGFPEQIFNGFTTRDHILAFKFRFLPKICGAILIGCDQAVLE